MSFDRKTMIIPDNTVFEEHTIVTDGDVIVSDGAKLEFGIKTTGRIFIGENATIEGSIDADGDVHVDIFSKIDGDVSSKNNVYLGEKVIINGKLSVDGDLDVGDDVEIKSGFEAKGWINIRSSIPVIIYIFIYLLQLLRLGKSEEIERILKELEENKGKPIPVSEVFLFVPSDSIIGIQNSKSSYDILIGKSCRVIGNLESGRNVMVNDDSIVYGSLKSLGTIVLGNKVDIHGSSFSRDATYIGRKSRVRGDITANRLFMSKNAMVEGTIIAKKGVTFADIDKSKIEEKLRRFEVGADIIDEVEKLME